jgi:uncharacterized protein (TIGR01244 family)
MVQFATVDKKTSIAGQLHISDMQKAATEGYTLIINNRPDGESFGQPNSEDLSAEAEKHNLTFVSLPFSQPAQITPTMVAEFVRLFNEAEGKVLVFCRSGWRSTILWAAGMVALEMPIADVLEKTASIGINLQQAVPFLQNLAKAAQAISSPQSKSA